MVADPLRRFSSRVGSYARFRPGYPSTVLDFLREEGAVDAHSQVADIGSGTGILSQMLLDYGCEVTAVEPNTEMRAYAERTLAGYPRFRSVNARAEATTLPDHSIDLITAAQSFHWFEPAEARREFARILRPPRWVALIWNRRVIEADAFSAAYDELLHKYGTDYGACDHRIIDDGAKRGFYGNNHWKHTAFANRQDFDFAGLKGRIDSTSYAPPEGSPEYDALIAAVQELYKRHAVNGQVPFLYSTEVYLGTMEP